MDYVALGKSNLLVSCTAFGAMSLDETASADETAALVKQAYEGGINFFDTARSASESELRLGEALKDWREDVFIATKSAASTAAALEEDLQASLKALKTDYIDLYQLENVTALPVAEGPDGLMEKLLALKADGIIRHFGIMTEDITVAQAVVDSDGPWETLQYPFNMLCSSDVEELVAACAEKDIGFIAMRPLCGGVLTNIPLALGYLHQFENVVPVWGMHTAEEMQQILYFTDNPPVIDDQFREEAAKIREFFN
ncbi:MAG: aldo/keto reductase [Treponema sp.]|nr:aldo/keto reductase [Treponema sp.]